MKTINKIYLAACLVLMISSCSLKEEPYGFLNSSQFYKTSSDVYSALGYCYDVLGNTELYSRMMPMVSSIGTEEFTIKPDAGADNHELDDWNVTSTNPLVEAVFGNCFVGINRANILLDHIDPVVMDEATKNEYKGEALFLRSLHYFNLVRLFGQVPLRVTAVTSASQVPAGLASMSDIYARIEKDLIQAEGLMDTKVRDGRANKVAAQALLAKMYLQLASAKATGVPKYDFVSNAADYYTKAATYANKVLTGQNSYTFWTGSLPALWDVDNQVGNEFIFSVAFHVAGAVEEGDFSKLSMMMVPYVDGSQISFGPNYSVTIRDGWNHLQTEIPFYNSFDSNDKRKTELIISSVKLKDGTAKTFPGGGLAYPFTLKYIDKKQGITSDQTAHYSTVLRFSDIALVYAEALGATTEAYTWVNKIRNRAGLPNLAAGLSDNDFRAKVWDERSFELAFEGQRLFDLRRTHQIAAVLNTKYGKSVTDASETAYFYKIPQREIDNNPLLSAQ